MSKIFLVQDTWGVGSLRQCAGFPTGDLYCAPLGCSLVKWNMETKKSTLYQIHNDLITVMIQNKNGDILTVGFAGEVKLWNAQFELLAHFQSTTDNIFYGAWSPDGAEFCVFSKGPNQKIIVYNFHDVLSEYQSKTAIKDKWSCPAPQSADTEKAPTKIFNCFSAGLFKANLEVIAVYQSTTTCELFLFSSTGEVKKKCAVSPLGDDKNDMLCAAPIHDNILAVGLQHGVFGFYDVDSLDMLSVLQAVGSPQICLWNKDLFVVMSYVSGVMSFWNKEGSLVQEVKGGPTGSIIQMNVDTKSRHVDTSSYYLGGIMSLHKVSIEPDKSTMTRNGDIYYLSLTGCGVAVNTDDIVASGDFVGNVYLWRTYQRTPAALANVQSSIRCLLWIKDVLLIGTLNGELYCWQDSKTYKEMLATDVGKHQCLQLADSNVKTLYHFIGSVVAIETDSKQSKLAVGTTGGYLYVFFIQNEDPSKGFQIIEDYNIQIHKPKKQADGSLLNVEIWSLAWSVEDRYLATTSEDQTTIISDAKTGEVIQTLTGHTTAVTGVNWKVLTSGKHVLTTCADDQTVRIYDGATFELLHIVNTHDIYGWHTLTYLCVNTVKDLLMISTQNGYIVGWDLNTLERICCYKMHSGSVEGLVLSPDQRSIVTIGSDCAVNRFSLTNF